LAQLMQLYGRLVVAPAVRSFQQRLSWTRAE
jgi:hypothetical protein